MGKFLLWEVNYNDKHLKKTCIVLVQQGRGRETKIYMLPLFVCVMSELIEEAQATGWRHVNCKSLKLTSVCAEI